MASLPVVKDLDVREERSAGRIMRAEGLSGEQFAFQGGEETLDQRVIIAITHRAHRAANPNCLRAVAEAQRGGLTARVGVVTHPVWWSPVPDGHRQRPHDELCPHVIRHGPADHPATEDNIQDHRARENAR